MGPVPDPLACVRGRTIVLVSHDLSQTGSPLLLIETAIRLREAGGSVRMATIADDAGDQNFLRRHQIPVVPIQDSFTEGANADLVIVNTAEASGWVDHYLAEHPAAGRALIWWIHEMDAASYAGRMSSLHRATMSIFDSHASLRNWTQVGVGLPGVSSVLHPCVEDALVDEAARLRLAGARDQIRTQLGVAPGDFAISLIGTYGKNVAPPAISKGHDLLMRTVGRMMVKTPALPLKVIVVGFPSEADRQHFLHEHESAAGRALDERRVVGITQDLTPYYAASDAFVMNTQGLGENFGRVTIEAMAFGLPVLGTDAGGTPEIIEQGVTGLLHPVGAAGQVKLADNLRALMRDPVTAKAMGEAGIRRVREHFASRRFLSELGSLLQVVLGAEVR